MVLACTDLHRRFVGHCVERLYLGYVPLEQQHDAHARKNGRHVLRTAGCGSR